MANYGMIAALCFVAVNVTLFVLSMAFDYKKEVAIKEWVMAAWTKRQTMAAPVLSAVYDTGTDLGVMLLWHEMMQDENRDGVEHIDMEVFFALGIVFMALPRVVVTVDLICISHFWEAAFALVFFDFLWIYDFWKKGDNFDATLTLQMIEAVCESIPQMILQSIFLVLTSDASGLGAVDYILMVASMIASAASITHRIVWADADEKLFKVEGGAYEAMFFGWRFCQVVTRLCVFSLMFATVGPVFLPVYYLLSLCAFGVFFKPKDWLQCITLLASPIVILHDSEYLSAISPPQVFRRYDNFLALVIIAIFMFIGFDCVVCADSSFRTRNPFAEGLFFAAFICFVAETVLFVTLQPAVSDKYMGRKTQAATRQQVAGGTQLATTSQQSYGPGLPPTVNYGPSLPPGKF